MWCTLPLTSGERGRGRGVVDPGAAALLAADRPAAVAPARSKPSACSSRPSLWLGSAAYARAPSKPSRACSAGISGDSARNGRSGASLTASSWSRPSGSAKISPPSLRRLSTSAAPRRSSQKSSACRRAHPPEDAVDHARARAPGSGARVLEEGQVHPRRAVLVAVEEVVHGRVVLVDRALDHPQAEQAGVELDVPRGRHR